MTKYGHSFFELNDEAIARLEKQLTQQAAEAARQMFNMSVAKTVEERGKRYGSFDKESEISMGIKRLFRYENLPGSDDTLGEFREGWVRLSPAQQSALDLIALKIARIINGDPDYIDNWHDIGGYALLIERLLENKNASD